MIEEVWIMKTTHHAITVGWWCRVWGQGLRRQRVMLAMGMVMLGAILGGCNQALFTSDAPRSQYERYGALRGDARPAMEKGPYGDERPALRSRLQPLESR